jgi:hypothetical protein
MHFNETATRKVTPDAAPNSDYDAFYLLAYATYALGNEALSGESLARAIARLLPPGKSVEVGPGAIFDGFATLRAGEKLDLRGAFGSLDFDVSTGEVAFDHALLCVGVDDNGRASFGVESGVVYASGTNRLEGALRCR